MNKSISLESVITELRGKGFHIPLQLGNDSALKDTVPFRKLLEGNTLKLLVCRIAERMNAENLLAPASLFQKQYTAVLLGSVIHPLLNRHIGILADSSNTEIVLTDDLPTGILLNDAEKWMMVNGDDSIRSQFFHTVLDDNLGQLIYRIASEIGLSPMTQWGNVGNYAGYIEDEYSTTVLSENAKKSLDALLHSDGFAAPDLSSLYTRVKLEGFDTLQTVRIRTTCCLRHQFPSCEACYTCPRLSDQTRLHFLRKYKN